MAGMFEVDDTTDQPKGQAGVDPVDRKRSALGSLQLFHSQPPNPFHPISDRRIYSRFTDPSELVCLLSRSKPCNETKQNQANKSSRPNSMVGVGGVDALGQLSRWVVGPIRSWNVA